MNSKQVHRLMFEAAAATLWWTSFWIGFRLYDFGIIQAMTAANCVTGSYYWMLSIRLRKIARLLDEEARAAQVRKREQEREP